MNNHKKHKFCVVGSHLTQPGSWFFSSSPRPSPSPSPSPSSLWSSCARMPQSSCLLSLLCSSTLKSNQVFTGRLTCKKREKIFSSLIAVKKVVPYFVPKIGHFWQKWSAWFQVPINENHSFTPISLHNARIYVYCVRLPILDGVWIQFWKLAFSCFAEYSSNMYCWYVYNAEEKNVYLATAGVNRTKQIWNVGEKVKPYWPLQTSQWREERWWGWGWRGSLLSRFWPLCIPGGPETSDLLWKVSIGSLLCMSSWYWTTFKHVIMDQLKHC